MPPTQGTSFEQKSVCNESSVQTLSNAYSSADTKADERNANPVKRGEVLSRHFSALTKKNAISWARTPIGSCVELLLPMLLMLSVVWIRSLITPDYLDSYDISNLKKAFYPTSKLTESGDWKIDFNSMSSQSDDVADFMKYSDVWPGAYFRSQGAGAGANLLKELTVFQEKSPFFFAPPHCIQRGSMPYSSPLIGYVTSDNQIQNDVIEQLSQLFGQQRDMLAMLSAIAAEGAGNAEGADARMNNAIAKFIGIEFITKAILMDQGFDEVTAGKMASALVNKDGTESNQQMSILTSLGLDETQANTISGLFRIQSDGFSLNNLNQIGIIDSDKLNSNQKVALQYVLSTSQQEAGAPGFDLAAIYKMGLFDNLDLTDAQRQSLATLVQIQSGEVEDSAVLETSVLVSLGVKQNEAAALIKAFRNKDINGLPADLIRGSGLVESLKLTEQQTKLFYVVLDNYGKKMSYQNLVSSNALEQLGLSDQEQIAIESLVGLQEGELTLKDLKDTGLLAKLEESDQGKILEEVLALASGDISAASWEDSSILRSLNLDQQQKAAIALVMDVSQNGLTFTRGKVEALLVGQGVAPAKAKTAAKLLDLQNQKGDYSFEELKKTGVFDDLDLTEDQMKLVEAAASLAPSMKGDGTDINSQIQTLISMTEMPLIADGKTLGDQIAIMLPALLANSASADQNNGQLGLLNLLMNIQQQAQENQANGQQSDLISLLLPAIISEYVATQQAAPSGGRRLQAEHVDFDKLQNIFNSEEFQQTAVKTVTEASETQSEHARYHQIIVDMHIVMPEEMEGDMMAVLNHGGLNAEQSEAVALLLIHAPLGENPHLINTLDMSDKQDLLNEVQAMHVAGTLDLKFLGFGNEAKTGRRLQQAGNPAYTPGGSTGPSTQIIVMNVMNRILSALTGDFQKLMIDTFNSTQESAQVYVDIIVNIWSDKERFLVGEQTQAWMEWGDLTRNLIVIVKCLKYNVPLADWPLNFVTDLDLNPKGKQFPLIMETLKQASQAAIGGNRYYLTKYGATKAQIDTVYDFIYNGTVTPSVYMPASVDTVVQALQAIGQYTNVYTAEMGVALGTIVQQSVANGTDLTVAISQLQDAGASNQTIIILTGMSWYIEQVMPSVQQYLNGTGNVTLDYVMQLHINISNKLAPILVAKHNDTLRLIGLQPAQTQVLFYYLGYNNDTLPLTKALAETLNLPESQTAFTGQGIKATTTMQMDFSDSTEFLNIVGMTPAQFICVRGLAYAAAEAAYEYSAGMQANKTVYPTPGWWTYGTLGYRNPEVPFLLNTVRPQDMLQVVMGYQGGYNLVGLPFGKAVADTEMISQQQGLVIQEMVYSYATGNVKQLANVLGISQTTAQLLYLVSQGQFRELHELLFTNSGHQLVLTVDSNGIPVADMNATIATILFRELGIDAQNARYYGGASSGEINYEFVGLTDEEARLIQKLSAGQIDIPALKQKGQLTSTQAGSIADLSGFSNDSVPEIWLKMQLWNNQGISPKELDAYRSKLQGRRLAADESNLTQEQERFIDIIASVVSGQAPLTALTDMTMMSMLGLDQKQATLVTATIEARDSGFKAASRSNLFDAMDLNKQQQAKIGLAIDLKDGDFNPNDVEVTNYLQELNLTKDQILAFTEVAAISNGEYDSKLNETDLAIKFGINVAEIEILTEARILEETLDLSNLEGTQLAKVMGISDEQIRQMVSIQNGNFTAMMDSGVLKQLGFEREQQVLEGVFKLAAKKDMQFNLLQAAATAMSAHDLYQDRMANANSLTDQADALTALVNVGLTESGSGLSQDQIKAITLMMDLMSGQKQANEIGLDDYRSILVQQGLNEEQIEQIGLLQKLSGGDFNYDTLEQAGVFEQLGLNGDQLQKLQIAYNLMDEPLSFQKIAESGLIDGSPIMQDGSMDLLIALENDSLGSTDSMAQMAAMLGMTEEQITQIQALVNTDGSKGITTEQLQELAAISGFEISPEQVKVLGALEKLPKGVNVKYADLVDSGLFAAIELPAHEQYLLERLMLETQSGSTITIETLKNAGFLGDLSEEQFTNLQVAMKVQSEHPELFNNVLGAGGLNKIDMEAAIMAELANDEYTYMFYDMRLLGKHYSNYLEKEGSSEFGSFEMKAFNTKEDMENYFSHPEHGYVLPGLCFGFQITEKAGDDFELEMIVNDYLPTEMASVPLQAKDAAVASQAVPLVGSFGQYALDGFSQLQSMTANTILKRKSGQNDAQITSVLTPFKTDGVQVDTFNTIIYKCIHFIVILCFVPLVFRQIYNVVAEKQSRAKEIMMMMGMDKRVYWASWYFWWSINSVVISLGLTSVLYFGQALTNCDFSLLFCLFFVFSQALFGYMLVAQSLFFKSLEASLFSTLIYFGTATSQFLINQHGIPRSTKLTMCSLFPTVAVSEGIFAFVAFEGSIGATWQTIAMQDGGISVQDSLLCMLFGGCYLLVLGFFLEYNSPKEFGESFDLLAMCKKDKSFKASAEDVKRVSNGNWETRYTAENNVEPVASNLDAKEENKQFLMIEDLFKTYSNGHKALNGINLKIYQDQIFALLGQNGAGKTTFFSILTGLYQPSRGSGECLGNDLFKEMHKVRSSMGVCPQFDVMFELLTVEEHLDFFYELKCANPDKKVKSTEITKLMTDAGVIEKRSALVSHLSGGNRRKVSVCVSLCGNSKFVLLDEPTSGMDLGARRKMWNMLREYRRNRIICLTTHYMDEADVLGDRIGIMTAGQLSCLGSSMFLKKRFGKGYKIFIQKKLDANHNSSELLKYFHVKIGSDVVCQTEGFAELAFYVPQHHSEKLSNFLEQLDNAKDLLGIKSYGIAVPTLEDVFFAVKEETSAASGDSPRTGDITSKFNSKRRNRKAITETGNQQMVVLNENNIDELEMNKEKANIVGLSNEEEVKSVSAKKIISTNKSFIEDFKGVVYKRAIIYKRDPKRFFQQSIVPAILFGVGFQICQAAYQSVTPPMIQLPNRLPLPQKLLFNPSPVVGENSDFAALATGLTEADSFNVNFFSEWTKDMTSNQYADEVSAMSRIKASVTSPDMYGSYLVYEADKVNKQYSFITYVNTTSQDAAGLFPQFMYESILRDALDNQELSFKVKTSPLPHAKIAVFGEESHAVLGIIYCSAVCYGLAISNIVSYLVVEKQKGLKLLQVISGMQLTAYWTANFVVDMLKLQPLLWTTILIFNIENLHYEAAWLTYLLLPFAILPFTYVTSFIFTSDNAAQAYTLFGHFVSILTLPLFVYIFRMTPQLEQKGDDLNVIFNMFPSYGIASSVFADALGGNLAQMRELSEYGTGGAIEGDAWAMSNVTGNIIAAFCHFAVWTTVLIFLEKAENKSTQVPTTNPTHENRNENNVDPDVLKEEQRIAEGSQDIIQLKSMRKEYTMRRKEGRCSERLRLETCVAVSDLSFGVAKGETLALLGVNGAGKTTTFKSLTSEVKASNGQVLIGGYSVSENFDMVKKMIGYCPQYTHLIDEMSIDQTMWYFATIRGVAREERAALVEDLIADLGLTIHRHKQVGNLSGGNKRKVSFGIAVMGNPDAILLDEPSAGVDPDSRRYLQAQVRRIAAQKTSAIVLTSHSMEEAEAVSSKMGIMVKGGQFKCFGSAQHIRSKFMTGFVIEIKISNLTQDEIEAHQQKFMRDGTLMHEDVAWLSEELKDSLQAVGLNDVQDEQTERDLIQSLHVQVNQLQCIQALAQQFSRVEMIERFDNSIKVRVPVEPVAQMTNKTNRRVKIMNMGNKKEQSKASASTIFALMEEKKKVLGSMDYSVTQTTLEQIFQAVVRLDENSGSEGVAYECRNGKLFEAN